MRGLHIADLRNRRPTDFLLAIGPLPRLVKELFTPRSG